MESLIVKGGWMMAPILFGSVVALALVLERAWFFWNIGLDAAEFSKKVFDLTESGNTDEALTLCRKTAHPLGAVFQAGIEYAADEPQEMDRVMEREGNRQVQRLEKNLNYLAVIIGIEPLMGFLGTILGLIQAFMAWEKLSSSVTVSALAAGIYQAMITTATGLIIAIPYYVLYNIFLSQVNSVSRDMNHYGDELVSVLRKSRRGKK